MHNLAHWLEHQGYILRSGGANGADKAFEGSIIKSTNKQIFLPWKNFNNSSSALFTPPLIAYQIAAKYHPVWDKLNYTAQRFMARNSQQILGIDCNEPVDFVICWTKDGKASGGTGQAMRIAEDLGIPIFNLYYPDSVKLLHNLLHSS